MKKTTSGTHSILIVGDWVVDEYWFLVRHQSDISSHTGFFHYRLSSKPSEIVSDLCSAGHVARVLYQLVGTQGMNPYELFGLGYWNEADTELIGHLVHARVKDDCAAAAASFRLMPDFCSDKPRIHLATLRPRSSTNRVIRQYHQEDGELKQVNRVDWEPQRPPQEDKIDWNKLQLPASDQVRAIVVHDLAKGVVTRDLVTRLRKQYPKALWYVRSKVISPDWLEDIENVLELLVIGPEVAALLNPWDTWLAYGKITIQALEVIEGLPGRNVALLSDQREVIARLNSSKHCITGKSMVKPTPITQLGWPSAFFAALVSRMYEKKSDTEEEDIIQAMNLADQYGGVPVPQSTKAAAKEKPQPNVHMSLWRADANDWHQATAGCGIIKGRKGELRLEVWRGSTYLPGYVACIREKQEIITRIGQALRAFSQTQMRPLSIMLQADAGAGKTFLAKSLASAFGYSFIRFDVTQMIRRDELLDLFDTLATVQANESNKVLIFVDEINALLDRAHVYGAFLAPLEESVYVRRGKIFSLKPCVWMFAGTKPDEVNLDTGEKLSDFKSRMTMIEKIDFKSLNSENKDTERLQNAARLEQVYLGAAMIGRHFSDVQEVSKEILERFHKLDPSEAPARKIRKMAASLRNVQYGRISRDNCQSWGLQWDEAEDGKRPVKLIFG